MESARTAAGRAGTSPTVEDSGRATHRTEWFDTSCLSTPNELRALSPGQRPGDPGRTADSQSERAVRPGAQPLRRTVGQARLFTTQACLPKPGVARSEGRRGC